MYDRLSSLLSLDKILELGQLTEQLNTLAYTMWKTTSPPSSFAIVTPSQTYPSQVSRNELHKALQYTTLTTKMHETPYLILSWRGTVNIEHIMVDLEDAPASHTFAQHQSCFLDKLNTLVSEQVANKKVTLVFSGHSLGGSLAQLCVAALTNLIHKQQGNPAQRTHPYLTSDTIDKIVLTTANSPGIEEKTIQAFSQCSAYLHQHTSVSLHALLLRTQGDLTQHHCSQIASAGTWSSRRIIIRPGLPSSITDAPQEIWTTLRGDGLQAGLSRTANAYLDLEKTHLECYLTQSKALTDTPVRIIQHPPVTETILQSGIIVFTSTTPEADTQLLSYLEKDRDIRHLESLRLVIKKTIPQQETTIQKSLKEGENPLFNWMKKIFHDTSTLAIHQAHKKRANKKQQQQERFWKKIAQKEHTQANKNIQRLREMLTHKNQQEERLTNVIWTMIFRVNILEDMLVQKNLASTLGWHCMRSTHFESTYRNTKHLWQVGIAKAQRNLTGIRPIANYQNWLASHNITDNGKIRKLWKKALGAVSQYTQLHCFFGLGLETKTLKNKQNVAIKTLHTCLSAVERIEENHATLTQEIEHLREALPHTLASGELTKNPGKW